MLKPLAIALGLLMIITRGLGVLFPGRLRDLVTKLASSKSSLRGFGVFALVVSLLIFVALKNDFSGARLVLGIIGIFSLVGGFLLLLFPARYAALVHRFMKLPDSTLRLLSGIGLAMGVLILYLGIARY